MDQEEQIDPKELLLLLRYGNGQRVADIASTAQVSVEQIYKALNKNPKNYEQAKQHRELVAGARCHRAQSLADQIVINQLEKLHKIAFEKKEDIPCVGVGDLKRLADLSTSFSTKANLIEGKVTARVENIGPPLTAEQWQSLVQQSQEVGNGLDPEALD